MPAENPFLGDPTGNEHSLSIFGIPIIDVKQSGSPSAPVSNTLMYGTPDTGSMTNAAGTSENIAIHLAVLVTLALIGVFVLRQAGIRFAFAVGGR